MASQIDESWMRVAISLSERTRAVSAPNPNVGCVLVKDGRVVGRGWTAAGGRPHAEAQALAQAADAAKGSTAYVSLEPCAHQSERGPCCTDSLIAAGVSRVVVALLDPDPRTAGAGLEQLRSAGIEVVQDVLAIEARAAMAGWLSQMERGRPFVTLKLATSLDGSIALANGESRWITGEVARAQTHVERARSNAILVGRGTLDADAPKLDVRLPGLEDRSPMRVCLSSSAPPMGWFGIRSPADISTLSSCQYLLIEGGARTAAAFLKSDLVDKLILYRAPIVLGGKHCIADLGISDLGAAHGRWMQTQSAKLGLDSVDVIYRKPRVILDQGCTYPEFLR